MHFEWITFIFSNQFEMHMIKNRLQVIKILMASNETQWQNFEKRCMPPQRIHRWQAVLNFSK